MKRNTLSFKTVREFKKIKNLSEKKLALEAYRVIVERGGERLKRKRNRGSLISEKLLAVATRNILRS